MAEPGAWVVIPAAGSGSRMGAELPKQYLPLAGKTVIEQTLEKVLSWPFLAGVVVALGADDDQFSQLPVAADARISTCIGGAERADSVLACLNSLAESAIADDWVLVHDAARPCVRNEEVNALYQQLAGGDKGGLLALPVAESVKRGDGSKRVLGTVEREGLWLAQTPQMFRYQTLKLALQAVSTNAVTVTDDAAAVEWAGGVVTLVQGHASNIKITHPQDLEVARIWLAVEADVEAATV